MNVKHFELVNEANNFLEKNYGIKLNIPIKFNARLKRVLGRFVWDKTEAKRIELSENLLQNYTKQKIFDVLKHELVHYALYTMNKPFDDGEVYFENELKKLDIKRTNTYGFLGEVHKYECNNCGRTYERLKKLPEYSRCNCSVGENLNYLGIIEKTDKEEEEIYDGVW